MTDPYTFERRLGAYPAGDGRAEFRVWAPRPGAVALRVGDRDHELADAGHGILEATVEARPGEDYAYVVADRSSPTRRRAGSRRPARALAAARRGRLRVDRRGLRAARAARRRALRAARRHVHRGGDASTRRSRTCAGCASWGSTTIELMPVAAFPGRHGWGYDGVYLSAAHAPYGGPGGPAAVRRRGPRRGPRGAARRRLQPRRRLRHAGPGGFGPYFTAPLRDAVGARDELRRRATPTPCASGCCRAPSSGSATSTSTGCGWTPSTRSSTPTPSTWSPPSAAACTRSSPRALVIAESGSTTPRCSREWGCDAVWADDFHHALRVLLTGDREGYYAEFGTLAELAKVMHRPHFHDGTYSTFRRRRFGAPADDVAPERFVVFSSNHDQVGNRALGDRLPVAARPLAAFVHASGTVHADALPGGGTRRARPVPVLLRPHRRGDRDRDPRGPPARVRRLRRVRRRGGPRPAGRGHLRRLQAHPRRASPRACATSTPRCCAPAPSCRPATRTPSSFDEHAGWLRAAPRRRSRCW